MTTTYDGNGSSRTTVVPPPTDPERIASLQRAVTEAESRAEQAEENLEQFKNRVVEVGNSYAEAHDWCSTYEDIMRDLGLPGRAQDWPVMVRVHATYQVTIKARSADEARDIAGEQTVSSSWARSQPFTAFTTGSAFNVEFETVDNQDLF